ncbi:MAG: ABC transporter substrate-binding protein [Clostridia bacterium]|nr:ABC transporter substrate-binding protein [Clostridia bacterium]
MIKLKKLLSLGIAAAMLLGAAACTGGKENKVSDGDDESQPYEIVWLFPVAPPNDLDAVCEKANEYLKDKINVTLKLTPLDWGAYGTKKNNALNGGEKMDLLWLAGGDYTYAAMQQSIIDIDELMDKYAPKTKEMLGEDFINGARVDGKLYGVQANKDKAANYMIVYRKDIAEKYNLDMSGVKTIEDLYPVFDTLLEKEPNMVPMAISGGKTVYDANFCLNGYDSLCGNKYVCVMTGENDDVSKVVCPYETELFKKSCEQAREMYQRGYFFKDCAVLDNSAELIKSGKAFCYWEQDQPSKLSEINNSSDYEWDKVQMTDASMSTLDCVGSVTTIPYTCENPVRVMKFIELFNTDPYLNNLINFGIEDVHFNKVSDNTIKLTEKGKKDYDLQGTMWERGNTFINYTIEGDDPNKAENLEAFNESAKPSPVLGFVLDTEEYSIEATACSNVVSEYLRTLTYGAGDPEELLPKFISKLKSAKIDTIVEISQRQYDEWREGNNGNE